MLLSAMFLCPISHCPSLQSNQAMLMTTRPFFININVTDGFFIINLFRRFWLPFMKQSLSEFLGALMLFKCTPNMTSSSIAFLRLGNRFFALCCPTTLRPLPPLPAYLRLLPHPPHPSPCQFLLALTLHPPRPISLGLLTISPVPADVAFQTLVCSVTPHLPGPRPTSLGPQQCIHPAHNPAHLLPIPLPPLLPAVAGVPLSVPDRLTDSLLHSSLGCFLSPLDVYWIQ